MLDELIAEFGIPGAVACLAGEDGLPKLRLTHASGASAEVYLHGAHVTSWRVVGSEELLFLSNESYFETGKPIRGGIPVCFPQFGGGPLPQHGFARTSEWEPTLTAVEDNGDVEVVFHLEDSSHTRAAWAHAFRVELGVLLSERSLTLRMTVENPARAPFAFSEALHTYFAVADIRRTAVRGLQGVTYIDSLLNNLRDVDVREAVRFSEETDRIYLAAPNVVTVEDESRHRTITITKRAMPDVVVWNPWTAKAQRMPDFGDNDYLHMVCVETGHMAEPRELAPGATWQGTTTFTCY
jgi:glucose-6-phosphate 1-epimerase